MDLHYINKCRNQYYENAQNIVEYIWSIASLKGNLEKKTYVNDLTYCLIHMDTGNQPDIDI